MSVRLILTLAQLGPISRRQQDRISKSAISLGCSSWARCPRRGSTSISAPGTKVPDTALLLWRDHQIVTTDHDQQLGAQVRKVVGTSSSRSQFAIMPNAADTWEAFEASLR